MASDSLSEARELAAQAQLLAMALDAIEARLGALELGADADVISKALAGPVRAFDAAAHAALKEAVA
jgi:hypothetical protein